MNRENFIELPLKDQLYKKVQSYIKTIWATKVDHNKLNNWLDNFQGIDDDPDEKEKLNMLFLLSKFSFLGDTEIRALLKALYRDLFKRPIIQKIRRRLNDTLDHGIINDEFIKEFKATKFVAVGGVSESGAMLMYRFRQENVIPEPSIVSQSNILHKIKIDAETINFELSDTSVSRYIFIDDFIGTGIQGKQKLKDDVRLMKSLNNDLEINYYVLVATDDGLKALKDLNLFSSVKSVFTLDDTFKAFDDSSRYYKTSLEGIDSNFAKNTALKYGTDLCRGQELGFGDCQLLFGFEHNTPDNSIPIFWGEENNWKHIFKRFIKLPE
jgi:hypothetical protein